MVDVGFSHTLEDCPQTQEQKKYLYLKAHASNGLSSALSAEIKDEIEMEYDCPERANLLWGCLSKCMSQAIARNHHQVLQRIYHHHLHILIKIKKRNQVLKKKN
jgi:hypothetical protein